MASPLPEVIPIIPTSAAPFHRPGWVYEEKIDGWRIVAYKDGPHVRLIGRRGVDHRSLSFAKTPSAGQVVDLSALI